MQDFITISGMDNTLGELARRQAALQKSFFFLAQSRQERKGIFAFRNIFFLANSAALREN